MDCSKAGFPVHHQIPDIAQTHYHEVGDAIQPSHLLCHPLLLLPSIFPNIRVFSTERSSIEPLVLCQIVVARVASIPVLSMILENIFCFSPLDMMLAVSLSYVFFPLLCWGTFLPYLICWEFLSRTNIKFCEMFFFYISYRWLYDFCPHSVNMM